MGGWQQACQEGRGSGASVGAGPADGRTEVSATEKNKEMLEKTNRALAAAASMFKHLQSLPQKKSLTAFAAFFPVSALL